MKFIVYILFCLGFIHVQLLSGQSISSSLIGSNGDYVQSGNISLSWSVGEPVIQTALSSNYILTQGFQQPLAGLSTIVESEKWDDILIKLYPNPTENLSWLEIQGEISGSMDISLISALGMSVKASLSFQNGNGPVKIDLSTLSSGVYFIRISHADSGFVKNISLIKK